MVEEMGREELLEEVHRLKVMVSLDKPARLIISLFLGFVFNYLSILHRIFLNMIER